MFAAATGDLEALPSIPPVAALHAALADNPELARFVAEVDRRQASLALARSARVPDMTLSAGYRRFTSIDTQAFVIGASIPLPWFDRNRDGIRAAEASIDEARHAARAAELTMVARLADAYRALASANDDVTTLRRDVIPGARAVFETVQEGYELGRFGLLDVLDAQRTLVEAEAQPLEALTMYHPAGVAVERLVGQPLTDCAAEARP
jgi:cobalt-zinc-cadmium efflux system outer membrane protein